MEDIEAIQYFQLLQREFSWTLQDTPQNNARKSEWTSNMREIIFSRSRRICTDEFLMLLNTSSAFDLDAECSALQTETARLRHEFDARGLLCLQACKMQDVKALERFNSFRNYVGCKVPMRMYRIGFRIGGHREHHGTMHATHDAAIACARRQQLGSHITIDLMVVAVDSCFLEHSTQDSVFEITYENQALTEYRIWYDIGPPTSAEKAQNQECETPRTSRRAPVRATTETDEQGRDECCGPFQESTAHVA